MIPHVIHQIWLGGEPPAQLRTWLDGWRAHHPRWDYQLWTDDNRPQLTNEQAFLRAPSFAMKADLLRYELLREHGGVYIDADFECHHPIDDLARAQPLLLVSEFGVVCNEFMGARAHDLFVNALVEEAGQRTLAATPKELTAPHLLTGPFMVDELYRRHGLAFSAPGALLPGDYFFLPRTRVTKTLTGSLEKRYATHHALASWRKASVTQALRDTKLRTRVRRFVDLAAE
jgi:mannosyltransferase OCH1-like enzyme